MNISDAKYLTIDSHPFLSIKINDQEALIGELKWPMLQRGVVPLLSRNEEIDWSEILPEIHVPATASEDELYLQGFTANPTIVKMAQTYWKAINGLNGEKFQEGPVAIPK